MNLEFTVPVVVKNLSIVEADPFFLMVKESNQTCMITYHGAKNAMISMSEDCVHAVDMGKEPKGRIYYPNLIKCRAQKNTGHEKECFSSSQCLPSKEGDEKSFVQLKAYNNKLHIYCPEQDITVSKTRVVKCPNKIFTLALTATFTLNNVTYHGKRMNLVYNGTEDPLLQEKLQ